MVKAVQWNRGSASGSATHRSFERYCWAWQRRRSQETGCLELRVRADASTSMSVLIVTALIYWCQRVRLVEMKKGEENMVV